MKQMPAALDELIHEDEEDHYKESQYKADGNKEEGKVGDYYYGEELISTIK